MTIKGSLLYLATEVKKRTAKNPFELLQLVPDADDQTVIEKGRLLSELAIGEEKKLIIRSVEQIIKNRIECTLFTYHGANYENKGYDDNDSRNLNNLIFLLTQKRYSYEFGLLKDFYRRIDEHPASKNLFGVLNNRNENDALKIWKDILDSKLSNKDPWFIHSLALLHQESAEDFEEGQDLENVSHHWEKCQNYWFILCCDDDFWSGLINGCLKTSLNEISAYREKFPEKLLSIHKDGLHKYFIHGKTSLAKVHLECIKRATGIQEPHPVAGIIKNIANDIIDEFTSSYLQNARRKLEEGNPLSDLTKNYKEAINYVEKFLELDAYNKRALSFIVEQYNEWCYILIELKNNTLLRETVEKSEMYLNKLAGLLVKGQEYLPENRLVGDGYFFKGLLADNADQFKKYCKQALEYDPYNNKAKQLLSNV